MEKPVIATDVGGIPELMKDNETGFLVPKNNPEELAEKISVLMNDSKKSEDMGKNGKDFVTTNFNLLTIYIKKQHFNYGHKNRFYR